MTTNIRFLHSMQKSIYLEQALKSGLMFTDHPVKFSPFSCNNASAQATVRYALDELQARATALGATSSNLSTLSSGFGPISGKIPMICFTEVHDGRDLFPHYVNFGAYGLVVKQSWLESSGGDRVVYTGPDSALTGRLHRLFIDHQIAGLHVKNGVALYDSKSLDPILNLLAYIQGRDQLIEAEWRIAGEHGFTGRKRVTGDRIPLPLDAIDAVLVQKDEDVAAFEEILKGLPGASTATSLPRVFAQPSTLPDHIGIPTSEYIQFKKSEVESAHPLPPS